MFFSKFSHKIILVRCHPLEGVTRGSKETTAKKGHHSPETKVVIFFGRKNRVTPSVAAPGDTDTSDATAAQSHAVILPFCFSWKKKTGTCWEVQNTGEEWQTGTVYCKEEEKEFQNGTEKSATHIEIWLFETDNWTACVLAQNNCEQSWN